jgi:hypothetical protein
MRDFLLRLAASSRRIAYRLNPELREEHERTALIGTRPPRQSPPPLVEVEPYVRTTPLFVVALSDGDKRTFNSKEEACAFVLEGDHEYAEVRGYSPPDFKLPASPHVLVYEGNGRWHAMPI